VPPDLREAVEREIAGWGADHVTVAVRSGDDEPLVIGDGRAYDLASVTKLFTAVAALVAVEEEAITLADPAGPEGSTIEHLLAHASGLDFDSDAVLARPGTRRIYSNTGYEALGRAIADATEIAFAEYATEALGLAVEPGPSPAHGWRATAVDVLALVDQVRRPTLVAPETMARATTVAFPGLVGVLPGVGRFDPLDWGLGFELRDGKDPHWTGRANSPRTAGHFGARGTFAWADPDADVSCVALTDRDFGEWSLQAWPRLADLVLKHGV
jgi:CubicO group peptidase (beta-lactamase class C family)